ncbi:MAG TPA: FtsX-like permease family protein, partial [Tepidisphaeraceae bacterium]|nr:FtsX-like permease family protein [Tepidisphaeraceae bacterium]
STNSLQVSMMLVMALNPPIQRQIVLPMSKAVEIAYKSLRLRLSRSLLVTSGIILALAFLMSILTTDAMTAGMRRWLQAYPQSTQYKQLAARRQELESASAQQSNKTATTELEQIRAQLIAPQRLREMMTSAGVPTTAAEIDANRIQTRWLIGLALLVAFVGILNAMLMSVTERFREIGTMKCLGALDSFIIKLFLIESLFQGVVGTVLGVIVGALLAMASQTRAYGSFAWTNVPWMQILTAAGICLAVGIGLTVAGALYPAWQAARMQPIEAMRVET